MKFSKLAAASALVLASAGSFAASLGPIDLSSGSAYFGNTPTAGAFTDTLTFTVLSPMIFSGSLTSVVSGTQNVDFTSITITPGASLSFVRLLGDPVEVWATPTGGFTLAGGAYTLTLIGTNSASSGSYGGNVAVTAVPEPATYAMLFAGLGIVGFAARRRRS